MSLNTLIQIQHRLARMGAAQEARWILEWAHKQSSDPVEVNKIVLSVVDRREKNEPLAYIFGSWPFCGVEFKVGPGVLIPRPETEELATKVAMRLMDLNSKRTVLRLLDLCAGSGCLGLGVLLTLAERGQLQMMDEIRATFVEVSPDAMSYLESNIWAVREELMSRGVAETALTFEMKEADARHFDVPQGHFDVLVSNPPYLTEEEYLSTDPGVRDFEPKQSLFVESHEEIYRNIIERIAPRLSRGAIVACEIGPAQISLTRSYVAQGLAVESDLDLSGKERFLWLEVSAGRS